MLLHDLILPTLYEQQEQQNEASDKFYKDRYLKVKEIISGGEHSLMGNVVVLENDLVMKWNRYSKDNMLREIRYQNVMYCHGLAVKIHDYYQTDNHVYFIMNNLIKDGYTSLETIIDNGEFNTDVAYSVAFAIDKMHRLCLVHNDLHEANIFYKSDSVKFIDFDKASFVYSYEEAKQLEDYNYFYDEFEAVFDELEAIENE
jgi:tRNA A-37 threonylcarbamoyl transferase component Bud32